MRGLEPPRGCPHTDLNRARLPIPPHPRGAGADDSNGSVAKLAVPWPPSSRGLGRRPLTAETGVRIPVAVLDGGPSVSGLFSFQGPRTPPGRPRAPRRVRGPRGPRPAQPAGSGWPIAARHWAYGTTVPWPPAMNRTFSRLASIVCSSVRAPGPGGAPGVYVSPLTNSTPSLGTKTRIVVVSCWVGSGRTTTGRTGSGSVTDAPRVFGTPRMFAVAFERS